MKSTTPSTRGWATGTPPSRFGEPRTGVFPVSVRSPSESALSRAAVGSIARRGADYTMIQRWFLAVQVFGSVQDDGAAQSGKYQQFLRRYADLPSANDRMKGAMTDIAFETTRLVWRDLPSERRGDCYFCVGGVNAINPFSAKAVKNEIVACVDMIPADAKRIPPDEGVFYDMRGDRMAEPLDLAAYEEIYMDFNGSMAFFNDAWQQRLTHPAVLTKVFYPFVLNFDLRVQALCCILHCLSKDRLQGP